jgi:hypothetical protein
MITQFILGAALFGAGMLFGIFSTILTALSWDWVETAKDLPRNKAEEDA